MPGSPSFSPPVRAAYAADPAQSRGRVYPETASRTRTPFARDRDRIIHAQAFRRLKGKTQVFVAHGGDHFRTRLTHSLEVAQIARSLAYALGLDADLAETIALGHDLGHPPFGHAGEDELSAHMQDFGGFDHNVQTFRVVTELERRYPLFHGLNLTWETLEGIIKHNGPVTGRLTEPAWRPVVDFNTGYDLELGGWPSAEAQVAAIADDIAYNNHDVDDGLQAELFTVADLAQVPLIGPILAGARKDLPAIDNRLLRLEAVRRMIGAMIDDVLAETSARARAAGVASADDVRALSYALVQFSRPMLEDLGALRQFLMERMYRHPQVNQSREAARQVLADLFARFIVDPAAMPPEWTDRAAGDEAARARAVCDYIAGMTDRYAFEEHRRLFGPREGVGGWA